MRGQTIIEKILSRYTSEPGVRVYAGDFVALRPLHVMTHDNTGAVIPKFTSIGARNIFDRTQPVIALDHDVQNTSPVNLAKYRDIESFARKHNLAFYPAGSGIAHQVIVEEGFALPGSVVVGSDSHSNIYGALCVVGTPVVRTDAAAIWATGQTWWQVPDIVQVNFHGELRMGVSGKDVILGLIGALSHDEVLNCAIEFAGPGVSALRMDQRLTISNMTTEWGALVGLFPYDSITRDYLIRLATREEVKTRINRETLAEIERLDLQADPDAYYTAVIDFDLSLVQPSVAGPNEVKNWQPLNEIAAKRIKIDKAYLLSCVNGRLEDIAAAAEVLQGRRIASGVKFYLAAASATIEATAREEGYWQTLIEAGAIPLPPGCGPCIGLGEGILQAGEVAISATNRNFKGRMGSPDAQAYLASPAVVAASAAAGYITGVAEGSFPTNRLSATINHRSQGEGSAKAVGLLPEFPAQISGNILLLPRDNLNTDGIYGKEYTYQDNLTPEEMASKAFLNYDPAFQTIAQEGDILVGGWNFGTGSSREQAATALKYRKIALIIAGSFSQTYKRNAFNNGYIVIECPALVAMLREKWSARQEPTIRTDLQATIDFARAEIKCGALAYSFNPLGEIAQRLILAGGFENLLLAQIKDQQKGE